MEKLSSVIKDGQDSLPPPQNTSESKNTPNDSGTSQRECNALGGPAWADVDCPECRGAGFVHPRFYDGKPDYQKAIACVSCYYQMAEGYIRQMGVNPLQTFTRFKVLPGIKESFDAAKSYAEGSITLLLIHGLTGNGKTHLCNAVMLRLFALHQPCRMMTVSDMIAQAKQSIGDNSLDFYMDNLKRAKNLILDDWKAEGQTPWAVETLEAIIDYRYNQTKLGNSLPMMITTNLVLSEIPVRVVSRFSDKDVDGKVVWNKAEDYRLKR